MVYHQPEFFVESVSTEKNNFILVPNLEIGKLTVLFCCFPTADKVWLKWKHSDSAACGI